MENNNDLFEQLNNETVGEVTQDAEFLELYKHHLKENSDTFSVALDFYLLGKMKERMK